MAAEHRKRADTQPAAGRARPGDGATRVERIIKICAA